MMNGMGFGHPLDFEPMLKTPGFIEMAWRAPIHLMAAGLGVEVDRDPRDARPPHSPTGNRGGVRHHPGGNMRRGVHPGRRSGQRQGSDRHRAHHPDVARRGARLAHIGVRRDIPGRHRGRSRHPLRDEPGDAEGHGAGHAAMAATAMRVVNAIPYVVDAPAGLLSSLDMPNTLPRHAFD